MKSWYLKVFFFSTKFRYWKVSTLSKSPHDMTLDIYFHNDCCIVHTSRLCIFTPDYNSEVLIIIYPQGLKNSYVHFFNLVCSAELFRKHCPLCWPLPLYKFLLELNISKKLVINKEYRYCLDCSLFFTLNYQEAQSYHW